MRSPPKSAVRRWTIFLLLLAVAFFALEVPAFFTRYEPDTLSEVVWHWMAESWAVRILVSGIFIWLAVHFVGMGKWDRALTRWVGDKLQGSDDA